MSLLTSLHQTPVDECGEIERNNLGSFSEEAKHAWRDAHWEEDMQKAFEAGKQMAKQ